MKFSLKSFLITLCIVGAVCGVMGKLLREQPEQFINLTGMIVTAGPFLLAIGTIIRIGWQSPRRYGLIAWACVLLFAPVILSPIVAWTLPISNPLRLLNNQRLIQQRLPNQPEQPLVWRELEYRAKNGSLTNEEADAAIQQLISYMQKTKPGGWNQPLSWQRGFLISALAAGIVSNETLIALADAYYGTQPTVVPIPTTIEGAYGTRVQINYGTYWGPNASPGVELLWDVKQVMLDGKPIQLTQPHRFVAEWSAVLDKLPAGDHELQLDVECAYVDELKLNGMSAYQIPRSRWPKARKQWTTTLKAPLKVTPKQDQNGN